MQVFKPKKCPADCVYAMNYSWSGGGEKIKHCGYLLKTSEARGCDPGYGCKRYKKKNKAGPKFQWDERMGFRLWRQGKTDREIAEALGVDREKIGQVRRRKWMKEVNDEKV